MPADAGIQGWRWMKRAKTWIPVFTGMTERKSTSSRQLQTLRHGAEGDPINRVIYETELVAIGSFYHYAVEVCTWPAALPDGLLLFQFQSDAALGRQGRRFVQALRQRSRLDPDRRRHARRASADLRRRADYGHVWPAGHQRESARRGSDHDRRRGQQDELHLGRLRHAEAAGRSQGQTDRRSAGGKQVLSIPAASP